MEEKRIFVYMRNSRAAHLFISNSIRIFARIKLDPLFFFFFFKISCKSYSCERNLFLQFFFFDKLKNYNGDK